MNELPHIILDVAHVMKKFDGLMAVDDVSFQVREGEILGIIGPNGAGKTVLINLISGFYSLSSGTIHLIGEDIGGLPLHRISRMGVARTFQNIRVLKRLSVLENVMAANQVHTRRPLQSLLSFGRQHAEIERAMHFIELMGLRTQANQLAGGLPYGQARRLEIARALASEPKLLLLDEPAAGMNEEETSELVQDVRKARTMVSAIVLIEHDMSLISALADRVIGVNYGRIMAQGGVAEVLANAEVKRAYLGEDQDP